MTSKYAGDIAEIKTDIKYLVKNAEKQNASQAKQWDSINANDRMIGKLEERISVFAIIQGGISAALAGAAAWFGINR